MVRSFAILMVLISAGLAQAQNPETESCPVIQSAADVLREAGRTPIAFLPAGMVRATKGLTDLGALPLYPTDGVAIVKLSGAQVRAALERSVALLPSNAFLQLSGVEASYSRSAKPDSRIVSVTVGGANLDASSTYEVTMPETLALGGLGYFKVWDRSAVVRMLEGVTLESLLNGKRPSNPADRWTALP